MFSAGRRPSPSWNAVVEPAAPSPARYFSSQAGPTQQPQPQWGSQWGPPPYMGSPFIQNPTPNRVSFSPQPQWGTPPYMETPLIQNPMPNRVSFSPQEQPFVAVNPFKSPKRWWGRPARLAAAPQEAAPQQQSAPTTYPTGAQHTLTGQPFRQWYSATQPVTPTGPAGAQHTMTAQPLWQPDSAAQPITTTGSTGELDWPAAAFHPPEMWPFFQNDSVDDSPPPTRLARPTMVMPVPSPIRPMTPPNVIQVSHPASRRSRSRSRTWPSLTVPHERRASVSHFPARRSRSLPPAHTASIVQPHDGMSDSAAAAVNFGSIPDSAVLKEPLFPELQRTDTPPQMATSAGPAVVSPMQSAPATGAIEIFRPVSRRFSGRSRRGRSHSEPVPMLPPIASISARSRSLSSWSHTDNVHASRLDQSELRGRTPSAMLRFRRSRLRSRSRSPFIDSRLPMSPAIFDTSAGPRPHSKSSVPPAPMAHKMHKTSPSPNRIPFPLLSYVPPPPPFVPPNILAKLEANESISSLPLPATASINSKINFDDIVQNLIFFAFLSLLDVVHRQLYLHFLLRIPSLYFTRVTRIFEDAQLSLPDIKKMARARAKQWDPAEQENLRWATTFMQQFSNTSDPLPRNLLVFRSNWESFISDLMSEWQTLNIISALLMPAILTMLQIDAASHPVTRTSALFSLICALMSLLYGCIYIIRFGSMRKMHKASSFAEEAQNSTTSIWWNVWVMLAMPAVWLAWAMILFFVCIVSFIWLSGASQDSTTFVLSPRAALGTRIALTVVFSFGLIYFVLIVHTFNRYGELLDREWMRRVNEWSAEPSFTPLPTSYPEPVQPQLPYYMPTPNNWTQPVPRSVFPAAANPYASVPVHVPPQMSASDSDNEFFQVPDSVPVVTPPLAFSKPSGPILQHPSGGELFKLMQLGYHNVEARLWGPWAQTMERDDLDRFQLDISNAWKGRLALKQADVDTGDQDAKLPLYTLLPLARPHTLLSWGRTEFSGSDASAPGNLSAEHSQSTSFLIKTRALSRSPSRSDQRSSLNYHVSDHPPSRSFSRSRERRSPPPSPPPDSYIAQPSPVQAVRELIVLWNERYFRPRNMEASLVPLDDSAGDLAYAINLAVLPPLLGDRMPGSSSSRQTPVVPHVSADVSNNLSPLGLTMVGSWRW